MSILKRLLEEQNAGAGHSEPTPPDKPPAEGGVKPRGRKAAKAPKSQEKEDARSTYLHKRTRRKSRRAQRHSTAVYTERITFVCTVEQAQHLHDQAYRRKKTKSQLLREVVFGRDRPIDAPWPPDPEDAEDAEDAEDGEP